MIGPVRSVRAEDPDIVWPLGGIFAYSGGAPVNVDAINAAPVHAVDENNARRRMVRNEPNQPPRDAPHNLYGARPAAVRPRRRAGAAARRCSSTSPAGRAAGRRPAASSTSTSGFEAGLRPDLDVGRRHRHVEAHRSSGVPQTVVGGAPIAPANVVVQFTQYAGEAEAQTVGEGDVLVFTDGVRAHRPWVRPDKAQPAQYVDAAGNPIPLRPGRTWVELLPVGSTVDVVAAPAPVTTVPPATTVPPTTAKKKK